MTEKQYEIKLNKEEIKELLDMITEKVQNSKSHLDKFKGQMSLTELKTSLENLGKLEVLVGKLDCEPKPRTGDKFNLM